MLLCVSFESESTIHALRYPIYPYRLLFIQHAETFFQKVSVEHTHQICEYPIRLPVR